MIMFRGVVVAITIAALSYCPLVCLDVPEVRLAAATVSHHDDSSSPHSDDPCHQREHNCICRGATLESRLEDDLTRALPGADVPLVFLAVPWAPEAASRSFCPSLGPASPPTTGRGIRIVLQSFLA